MERALELERKRPEQAAAVERGELEGHKALQDVKREQRIEKLAETAKGNAPPCDTGRMPYMPPTIVFENHAAEMFVCPTNRPLFATFSAVPVWSSFAPHDAPNSPGTAEGAARGSARNAARGVWRRQLAW